uniref:Uncharacterized protein n=1 Tax=Anguilla anguilla TaxID=7936 RepID=A0A0E9PMB4_ANGAN
MCKSVIHQTPKACSKDKSIYQTLKMLFFVSHLLNLNGSVKTHEALTCRYKSSVTVK